MMKKEVKDGLILGATAVAAGAAMAAGTVVTFGLNAAIPAGGTLAKRFVTGIGIAAAGYGVTNASYKAMRESSISAIAIIDKIGDKIIEIRESKSKKAENSSEVESA